MARTFHIVNFGCQMNAYEAELMEGILRAKGWVRAPCEAEADLVVFNTCVVREHAERRAKGRIGQLAGLKRRRPEMVIAVCGCMAQKEAERVLAVLPHVDLVLGPRALVRLGPLLDEVLATGQARVCVDVFDPPYPRQARAVRRNRLRALVPITYGCDNFCTYCIVPYTRGREVSRSPGEILEEIGRLVAEGCREITLVGQNVNAWRAEGMRFADLLRRVGAAAPEAWVRYITSHPRDCDEAHIAAVAETPNVVEHFHLPVQAGADEVLRRMGRGYTRGHYLGLVERVRRAVPSATVTTDLIVGFPGEGEAEYEQTLDLVGRVRFDAAFMYAYSPRSGTPAAERLNDHVAMEEKQRRLAGLIELQEGISLEVNRGWIGAQAEVLIEGRAPRTRGDVLGRTRGDKMVVLPGGEEWIGRFRRVEIREANAHTLFGCGVRGAVQRAEPIRSEGGSFTIAVDDGER